MTSGPGSGGIPSGDSKVPNKVDVELLLRAQARHCFAYLGFCHLVLSSLYLVLHFCLSFLLLYLSLPWSELGATGRTDRQIDRIGNKAIKPDSLVSCVLRNFDRLCPLIIKQDCEYLITKNGLRFSCELEWLIFTVKWSPKGTFDSQVAWEMTNTTLGIPGCQDQFGYILAWTEAMLNLPPQMKVCMVPNGQGGHTLVIAKKTP